MNGLSVCFLLLEKSILLMKSKTLFMNCKKESTV